MGFTTMGFFFILFPDDDSTIITKTKQKSNLSSLKSINTLLKPSNSTHLFPKAQFIISICVLLIFITLLLFTISTFEPSKIQLSTNSVPHKSKSSSFQQHALQKMGFLYRKGTKSMNDLIIAHVSESVTLQELKLFTRLILRSKITSKSDLLFIFPSKSIPFDNTIIQENNSFLKILSKYKKTNSTSIFDPTHFLTRPKKANESEESIWGRKKMSNFSEENDDIESTRLSYGSVIGFYADELDPENSLNGFMDHVPMSLRRWACYTMLLGRVRRNYKHVILVDVKEILLLGDPLSRVKNLSQDSVIISTVTQSNHRRKNVEKNHSKKQANPAIIMGGLRGVRRLSNAMLIEIVRESMQRKKKNSVTESVLLSQLVGNEFILKNVELISGESIVELSSLTELDKKSGSLVMSLLKYSMVRRGNSNVDISSVFKKYLCSFPLESTAYSDC
ncbi:uncharacterized protein LOC132607472 [Lycium barbarum]|uniref:uncharacterized protein LOC132607472 n=1 Tax=Lycium barbarum TaxID=112863 RepID=UPI00293F1481|nr:uncharacterized protein LOC132607472 [Lycium barbarum]